MTSKIAKTKPILKKIVLWVVKGFQGGKTAKEIAVSSKPNASNREQRIYARKLFYSYTFDVVILAMISLFILAMRFNEELVAGVALGFVLTMGTIHLLEGGMA